MTRWARDRDDGYRPKGLSMLDTFSAIATPMTARGTEACRLERGGKNKGSLDGPVSARAWDEQRVDERAQVTPNGECGGRGDRYKGLGDYDTNTSSPLPSGSGSGRSHDVSIMT